MRFIHRALSYPYTVRLLCISTVQMLLSFFAFTSENQGKQCGPDLAPINNSVLSLMFMYSVVVIYVDSSQYSKSEYLH